VSKQVTILSVALAANLLLAVIFNVEDAHACSCVSGITPEERWQESDAVFSGEVVDVDENYAPGPSGPHLGPVTFDVEESWKGVTQDSVVVHGYGYGPDCGIGFSVGDRYLVYAHRGGEVGEGPLETSICEGTKPLMDAATDLVTLGAAELALPEAVAP
jgi:hypothetical protein